MLKLRKCNKTLEGITVNKHFYRKTVAIMMTALLFFAIFSGNNKAEAEDALNIHANAAILVDAKTGRVLYQKNADTVLGIASMTKMMTEYILLQAIKEGKVKWDQEYSVSDYVYKLSQNRSLSNVPLRRDGKYKVRELYEAMTIYSANGATAALAEIIAGSEKNFVKMMNEKAKELGLKDYKFVNATGLNNRDLNGQQPTGGPDEENVMSARATAKLAYHLINEFPEVLKTASTPTKKFREGTKDEIKMDNWNWMLPGLVYGYEGMDGLKTGTTDFAGYCFTGTASRDGKRFITVVMNAKDASGKGSYKARFDETRKLLDYAFTNFTEEEIVPKNYQVKGKKTLPVDKGKEDHVKIQTKDAIKMVIKKEEKANFKPVLVIDKKKLDKNGKLMAPIKKGEKVGYLTLESKNGDLGYLTDDGKIKVDVVAAESVEKANWFVLMMRGIGGFFGDVWGSVSSTVKGWF